MHSITIVGTGYVGLVTGACLADFGNRVTCVDGDARKVEMLAGGAVPFFEPGLPELVARNTAEGRLRFTTDLSAAIASSRVVFVTVGTPPRRDGSADTRNLFAVARKIARHAEGYKLVIQKSTAPVGTARDVWRAMKRVARRGASLDVASNPEFLREGAAIETFMHPDRVVIGVETPRAANLLQRIYKPLFLIETPMVVTSLETAELIKYASNAFLATKISFINEIANVCEEVGADVQMVAKAMGMDRRIGAKFLHAGPGYGGSCFPKDTRALTSFARRQGLEMRVVGGTIAANRAQIQRMVQKIVGAIGAPRGKRAGILGLSFKPNTDDVRDAPALAIVDGLRRRGVAVTAYDPAALDTAREALGPRITYAADAYEAARGVDALVIVTEWNEFRNLDLARLRRTMRRRAVLCDLRNVYHAEAVEAAGLRYVGVGRGRPRRIDD